MNGERQEMKGRRRSSACRWSNCIPCPHVKSGLHTLCINGAVFPSTRGM